MWLNPKICPFSKRITGLAALVLFLTNSPLWAQNGSRRLGVPAPQLDDLDEASHPGSTAASGQAPSGFGARDLPGDWELKNPKRRPDPKGFTPEHFFRTAIGGGLGFPDLFPLEGYVFAGRYLGLRGFYSIPYPFKVRVEMPADDIQAKQGLKFANPDLNINFDASYGPHYGFDFLAFPFGGSFYTGFGVAHRRIHISGGGESPVVICSGNQAKPCSEQDSVVVTKTQLTLQGDVTTQSWMTRAMVGWYWELGEDFYFNTQLGFARPYRVDRDVSITASVTTPNNPSGQDLSPLLKELKAQKEAELEGKAVEAIEPYDSKTLPLIAASLGIRF